MLEQVKPWHLAHFHETNSNICMFVCVYIYIYIYSSCDTVTQDTTDYTVHAGVQLTWWVNSKELSSQKRDLCSSVIICIRRDGLECVAVYTVSFRSGEPDGMAEWIEHLFPVLGDWAIQTTLVNSNQWLKSLFLLLPSQALNIIRIRQGLVGSVSG